MSKRARHPLGLCRLGLLLVLGLGCELLVGTDGLDDLQCPAGQKACDQRCVSRSDPGTGCAASSCSPCVLPHATAKCGDDGLCAIKMCVETYADCDGTGTGCGTDLAHDPLHCGGCTAPVCVTAHGIAGCSAGICATGGCNPGFDDCDGDPTTGCETTIWTNAQCAACNLACATGTSCDQGTCL